MAAEVATAPRRAKEQPVDNDRLKAKLLKSDIIIFTEREAEELPAYDARFKDQLEGMGQKAAEEDKARMLSAGDPRFQKQMDDAEAQKIAPLSGQEMVELLRQMAKHEVQFGRQE